MNVSLSNLLNLGYKRALYATLAIACLTPGILYVYLKDPQSFQSLGNVKVLLLGIAIAAPVLAFNLSIAFTTVYLLCTTKRYEHGKRLMEEVLSRIILTSGILATGLLLNICVVILYFLEFKASRGQMIWALILDILVVIGSTLLVKKKADHDLFKHGFAG